ncbi:MAG TPA: phosphatase PAP2 family protein [Nitrososphaeraceae archaeon]|nr:phosphatase PAP2 family protein [Nitrososphaeraceae archaeon]
MRSERMEPKSKIFVLLILLFVILSFLVTVNATNNIDNFITDFFYHLGGDPGLDLFMIIVSSSGDVFTMVIVGMILTIIRRTRKIGLIFLISIVVLSISITYLKPLINRPSPLEQYIPQYNIPDNYMIENDSMSPLSRDLSFPSNHAARDTAFIIIIGYWFKFFKKNTWIGSLLWIFPILIGISRLYLLQNYFIDILGGALYGIIVAIFLINVLKLNEPFLTKKFNK